MDAARAALAEENESGAGGGTGEGVGRRSADCAQTLRIAKLERQVYGQKSERSARLIDQLALTFEELEASATEDELAATGSHQNDDGRRINTFPDHPRERVVIDPPTARMLWWHSPAQLGRM